MLNISNLIEDIKCHQAVRNLRWLDGIICHHCFLPLVIKDSMDDTQPDRQCHLHLDRLKRLCDLTGTIFAGHYRAVRIWTICLYLIGVKLSTLQIAKELDVNRGDA